MPIKLFNSLTREKEEFVPLNAPNVSFYNCGPTVYGEFHIGNARNFIVMDTIRRWLMARGFTVKYVQNITDVDDKIINRANKEGVTPEAIAEKYTAYFLNKLKQLGNLPADAYPKATEFIGPMVDMIRLLEERGHAYATPEGSVWFEVGTFKSYGRLSRMPLEDMRQGERVDQAMLSLKRSPLDFCLWKAAKPGEPFWPSPWSAGRPGWHIECSCMSLKTFATETIDIHAGGSDLKFPHHENEIAQSEAATGKQFARYWLHNGMLDIDGEKMSKSLGNILSLGSAESVIDALGLRYFLLSARYRDKLDFTEDNIHQCKSAVERLTSATREALRASAGAAPRETPEVLALAQEFADAMDDDINTPRAFGAMLQLVTLTNSLRQAGDLPALAGAVAALVTMRESIGLGQALETDREAIPAELAAPLAELSQQIRSLLGDHATIPVPASGAPATDFIRYLAGPEGLRPLSRKLKLWKVSDEIRDRLAALGVMLEDSRTGTTWKFARK